MSSTVGRLVVTVLTNKSGGAVAYGDVVITDSANDNAFTTTTTGAYTGQIGICIEPNGIANNASGRIQTGGPCAQINCNASVTRGYYLQTHTVAKQAAGSSTRQTGSFAVTLTTSATPPAILFGLADASTGAGGIPLSTVTTAGDLVVGTGASAVTRLGVGAAGTAPISNGTTLASVFPPGHEYDYAEITSPASITATTEATANTVVTGNAVTYDGSTIVKIECYAPYYTPDSTLVGRNIQVSLYDGSSSIGQLALRTCLNATTNNYDCLAVSRRLTPSGAAHTYSIRAFVSAGTGSVGAGLGGVGAYQPAYIRITKV